MDYEMGTWALRLVDDFVTHVMQVLFGFDAKTFYFRVAWGNLTALATGREE